MDAHCYEETLKASLWQGRMQEQDQGGTEPKWNLIGPWSAPRPVSSLSKSKNTNNNYENVFF